MFEKNSEIFFAQNPNSPFLKFVTSKSKEKSKEKPDPKMRSLEHKHERYYLFLLGLKTFKKYHLNVIFYDRKKNIIERFEPLGSENDSNENLKKYIIDEIVNIFNLSKSPLYKDFKNSHVQDKDSSDCVLWCLDYVRKKIEALKSKNESKQQT